MCTSCYNNNGVAVIDENALLLTELNNKIDQIRSEIDVLQQEFELLGNLNQEIQNNISERDSHIAR